MAVILTDLELSLAAMFLVGAVDLQLANPSCFLFEEDCGEVGTATVRAGLVVPTPFIEALLTEMLLAAVDQVGLT